MNALKNIKKHTKKAWSIAGVMCHFSFHDWEISKCCIFKDRKCKYFLEEGFCRTCQRCGKEQTLKRPEKYHPSKYVWTDSNGT